MRTGIFSLVLLISAALSPGLADSGPFPESPDFSQRDRMDRALQAVLSSDLVTAEQILLEDLPADRPTPSVVVLMADRFSRLAFELQNTDHDAAARHFVGLGVDACLDYLATGPERTQPIQTAGVMKLTGQLLKLSGGDMSEAARLFRLAYELDPPRQGEALVLAQALEERERVIAERRAEESRTEEVQP